MLILKKSKVKFFLLEFDEERKKEREYFSIKIIQNNINNNKIDHYDVTHHPDVTRGNRSENEIYREFTNAFDSYLAYKVIKSSKFEIGIIFVHYRE